MLAFAYVLVVVIVALEVPLALNLEGRAVAELKARALAQAQSFASAVGDEVEPSPALAQAVGEAADQAEGRVIVVDPRGISVADSERPDLVGTRYATAGRPELLRALDGDPNSDVRSSDELGQDILATAVPVLSEGPTVGQVRVAGAVRLTQSTDGVTDSAERATLGLVAIGLAGLVGGLILAVALAGSLSRPLRRLADAARSLGSGDLSSRTEGVRGAREVEELAHSFDEMAARVEASVRAQQEFVANASHQLRTPLAGMKLRLESAGEAGEPEEARRQVRAAEEEVDRLAGIVDRLLETARRTERGEPEATDLADAVGAALRRFAEPARRAGATLGAHADRAWALADRGDVDQMLDNLIDNALRYAPGPIDVETGAEGDGVFVAVADRGSGVSADEAPRLTERFFRGRAAARGGSGLGLAIVRELAERWGGGVAVRPRDGGGTRVVVRLPGTGDSP